MARLNEPASERQMSYLAVLQRKLEDLLEEGSSISSDLERAVASSVSKKDASNLIDTLIKAINRLGGKEDATVTPLRKDFNSLLDKNRKENRDRRNAKVQSEIDAYDAEQAIQFGVAARHLADDRPPPEGRGRYLKVWKRRPNHGYNDNYGFGSYEMKIGYGWTWSCSHPSHLGKGGPGSKLGVIYGGSITQGYEGTIEGALRHWRKFHAEEVVS